MSDDWTTGLERYRAEQYEEAVPYLERAARTTDEAGGKAIRGPALNHLGMAQYVLGRYEEAVATFRAAILQMPGKPRLHYNLGNSLLGVGRFADAKRQYELALDLDPDYGEAQKALVVVAAEAAAGDTQSSAKGDKTEAGPGPEPRALAVAPRASHPQTSPNNLTKSQQHVEQLEAQLRAAHEALAQTRLRLEQQEQAQNELVEELLAAVRAHALEQETAIQEAALRQAQALLNEAATRRP